MNRHVYTNGHAGGGAYPMSPTFVESRGRTFNIRPDRYEKYVRSLAPCDRIPGQHQTAGGFEIKLEGTANYDRQCRYQPRSTRHAFHRRKGLFLRLGGALSVFALIFMLFFPSLRPTAIISALRRWRRMANRNGPLLRPLSRRRHCSGLGTRRAHPPLRPAPRRCTPLTHVLQPPEESHVSAQSD